MEVCAPDFAGGGSDVVSSFAFQAGGVSRMMRREEKLKQSVSPCGKAIAVAVLCLGSLLAQAPAQGGGQLRFCLRSEPKTFDPLKVEDDASGAIRYLTGGVLVRVNRQTQDLEPGLAISWKVSKDGRQISFRLRSGISFSDGTPFSAEDVAYTIERLMDPSLHSPTGDAFRSSQGKVVTKITGKNRVTVAFPAPIVGLDRLFDQVAMMSALSPQKEMAVLGPY